MTYILAHFLVPVILVSLYSYFRHKKISPKLLFWAGLSGLVPDIDTIGYIVNIGIVHRGFIHTPLLGLVFLIPGLILWKARADKIYKPQWRGAVGLVLILLASGIFIHLLLDSFFITNFQRDAIMVFYPLSEARFGIQTLTASSELFVGLIIEAVVLVVWLIQFIVLRRKNDYSTEFS